MTLRDVGLTSSASYRPGMDRRRFVLLAGALTTPRVAGAQPAGRVARIGYLSYGTALRYRDLKRRATQGIHRRASRSRMDRREECRDRVPMGGSGEAHVRCPRGGTGAAAAGHNICGEHARVPCHEADRNHTPRRVFAQVSEPVAIGLVDSLSRPGRNFTGLTTINRELMSKRLELLKEMILGLTRVGHLANPGYAVHQTQLAETEAAARGLGLTLHLAEVRAPSEFEGAFVRMAAAHVGAFIVQ